MTSSVSCLAKPPSRCSSAPAVNAQSGLPLMTLGFERKAADVTQEAFNNIAIGYNVVIAKR